MKTISKIALLTAGLAASTATWAAGTDAGAIIEISSWLQHHNGVDARFVRRAAVVALE